MKDGFVVETFRTGFETMNQQSDPSSDVNPYTTKISDSQLVQPSGVKGDETGGLIPYKNPAALAAYYLGIFSIVPVLGLFLAVPALILGVVGLVARKRNPVIKGSVHAWIGIVMGTIFTSLWGLLVAVMIFGIAFG